MQLEGGEGPVEANTHLGLVVPHMHIAIVQTSQHPWLLRVKVHALDPVRPGKQFALKRDGRSI